MPILRDMSILVTGGAGFIGSHLVDALIKHNEVTVIDNLSTGKREYLSAHESNPRFRLIEADLLDRLEVYDAVKEKDIVFHLAANPSVAVGETDTRIHLEQNALTTYNLLEAMRRAGVRKIAFTSTSTVYGEAKIIPTPEDYGPLKPISLYGASKLACEAMISSYCHTFDMQAWIYRFANIVGERGNHGVIVDFIKKLRTNPKELEILGSGAQRKSYLDVRDCVDAMIHCVEHADEQVNIYNIGSQDTVDVREIADIVVKAMGLDGVRYRFTGGIDGRGWKGDVKLMCLSTDAIRQLGWRPRLGSREAVARAAESLLREIREMPQPGKDGQSI
ncbi:MAG TPA: NAD-dependent epimerase/dehydratase family protein [Methanothrix sp.]|nr:NAD-dependent epimerase/dehydratase family protein [Methanothrix sp.]HOK57758.1 NAD-dependent epimerase/dehydratase family protein [Methanothrix sp.]HOL43248.1 NAD-dependent epimerase/dehydratase family protein [Methanothrix sp.]HPO88348.1 NAD-dependent epimerase/dehydratase family protein [Methanothrix sp.]